MFLQTQHIFFFQKIQYKQKYDVTFLQTIVFVFDDVVSDVMFKDITKQNVTTTQTVTHENSDANISTKTSEDCDKGPMPTQSKHLKKSVEVVWTIWWFKKIPA